MKLDKSDALLIHSILFAYVNARSNMDHMDVEHLQDLQERLRDFIVDDAPVTDQGTDSEEEEEEEEYDEDDDYEDEQDESDEDEENEAEDVKIDTYVDCSSAGELPAVNVLSPDGSAMSLEFEDVDEPNNVDALLDNGTVIIEAVVAVSIENGVISLYDDEQRHDFKVVKKVPKSWNKLFPQSQVVGFEREE